MKNKILISVLAMSLMTVMTACGGSDTFGDAASSEVSDISDGTASESDTYGTQKESAQGGMSEDGTAETGLSETSEEVSEETSKDTSGEDGDSAAPTDALLGSFYTVDLNGTQKDASIFSGYSLTMVNVWATYCGPCINELPELGELSSAYAGKGVQVVGIVSDVYQNSDGSFDQDQIDTAQEIVTQTGAEYTHLLSSADLESSLLQQVSAVPTTVFVDKNGSQVGETYVGARSGDDWKQIIDGLLKTLPAGE